jgi:hypothetical protein
MNLSILFRHLDARLTARCDALERRQAALESPRTNQIGFTSTVGTWRVGNVPDGFTVDDTERNPGGWIGDAK